VEIEAGPVLFPGVAKEVVFELRHPKAPYPPATRQYPVRFHVTAKEAYPDERATLVQMIEIAPYPAHVLNVVDFSFD
ncbi:MAG: hypothetical protein KDE53_23285, partial [Caldilineaceae bacterium]|nr:hypothetical protein [Caldilineaceae bacterium]